MSNIRIMIQNEKDLYNQFDPEEISEDVISYIKDRADDVRSGLTLSVISDVSVDTEKLKKAFASYALSQKKKLDKELKWNLVRQLRLFFIGVAFIALWLVTSPKTEGVWPEILSIIGSFAVWEATSIWLIDNPKVRAKKLLIRPLENIEITCSSDHQSI